MTISQLNVQINKKKNFTKAWAQKVAKETLCHINSCFNRQEIEFLARTTGFSKRLSKICGFDFLVSLIVANIDPFHASLEKISEVITRVNRSVKPTAQALMKRINSPEAVAFLAKVFEQVLIRKIDHTTENQMLPLRFFKRVLLQDSTTIQLNEKLQEHFKGSGGRASKSFAKLDLIYDYKNKDAKHIKLTDQREADQKLAFDIHDILEEGDLVIRDLGYKNLKSMEIITSKNCYFLSRLKLNTKIYLSKDDKDELDLIHYFEGCNKNGILDRTVFLTEKKVPVRLVCTKAPENVISKRLREANQTANKQGRKLRDKTKRLMSLTIFITNVPAEIWKPEIIFTIYRVRWQIELIFKCWKSRMNIVYLKGINPERIRSLIYARMMLVLIANNIYKLTEHIGYHLLRKETSMAKVFEWIRDVSRLIKIIKGLTKDHEIGYYINTIPKSMCTQTRKRKTTLKSILEVELCA